MSRSAAYLPWMTEPAAEGCIFCSIVAGKIPAKQVYEDPEVLAFHDADPKAPTHVLVIPKRHIGSATLLVPADEGLAGRLILVAAQIAREAGISESGYRVVANSGADGGQTVHHLHLHLLGGRPLSWPPG